MSNDVLEVKLDAEYRGSGTTATVRWFHFEKMLRNEGKLHPNEKLEGVKISEDGIQYFIGQR